jgi:Ca2+-binding RTX toxin-like protein
MVFKAISGAGGDLNNPADFFGALDDVILVLSGDNDVRTYEGNDIVYTTRAASGSVQDTLLGYGNDVLVGGDGIDIVALGGGGDVAAASAGNDILDGGTGFDMIRF